MDVLDFLKSKPPIKFIEVKEGSYGLETYINPVIYDMEDAYKNMLIAFLQGITNKLEGKNAKHTSKSNR